MNIDPATTDAYYGVCLDLCTLKFELHINVIYLIDLSEAAKSISMTFCISSQLCGCFKSLANVTCSLKLHVLYNSDMMHDVI